MTDDDASAAAPLDRVRWPVRTERLLLRRMTTADAPAIWRYRRLDEVTRWVTSRPTDAAAWIAGSAGMLRDQLVIEPRRPRRRRPHGAGRGRMGAARGRAPRGRDAGGAGLDPGSGRRRTRPRDRGGAAALRIAFEDLGVRRVVASAFADNAPSLRLAERVGMRRESYAVGDSLHRDLGWIDGVGYALLAEEWAARG
ncbi:GNAT family N-acetyltransferase [Clavibacter zhangzhiyongii]|uniref:GNAT family N-acetyltransferase n=1 Tax=Clavibacter zhangzhiyongii TaxID=2768071 RepID=UPI0039DFC170